nr:beta-L-arabinofuranosidase domain-containing protein [Hymenobacter negativus]
MRNGYAVLARKWRKGDVVEMTLPMDVRRVVANPNVKDDLGKVALQRGPIVYCAEWADNHGKTSNILVPSSASFATAFRPDLLNGVTTLTATVPTVQVDEAAGTIQTVPQMLTAIPYYAWANRGKGEMTVWFPAKVVDVDVVTRPAVQREEKK